MNTAAVEYVRHVYFINGHPAVYEVATFAYIETSLNSIFSLVALSAKSGWHVELCVQMRVLALSWWKTILRF